jgi:hypothetical protein
MPVDYDFTKIEEVDSSGQPRVSYKIELSKHQSYTHSPKSVSCLKAGSADPKYRCNVEVWAYEALPLAIQYTRTVPEDKVNQRV